MPQDLGATLCIRDSSADPFAVRSVFAIRVLGIPPWDTTMSNQNQPIVASAEPKNVDAFIIGPSGVGKRKFVQNVGLVLVRT